MSNGIRKPDTSTSARIVRSQFDLRSLRRQVRQRGRGRTEAAHEQPWPPSARARARAHGESDRGRAGCLGSRSRQMRPLWLRAWCVGSGGVRGWRGTAAAHFHLWNGMMTYHGMVTALPDWTSSSAASITIDIRFATDSRSSHSARVSSRLRPAPTTDTRLPPPEGVELRPSSSAPRAHVDARPVPSDGRSDVVVVDARPVPSDGRSDVVVARDSRGVVPSDVRGRAAQLGVVPLRRSDTGCDDALLPECAAASSDMAAISRGDQVSHLIFCPCSSLQVLKAVAVPTKYANHRACLPPGNAGRVKRRERLGGKANPAELHEAA
eukprot:7391092-Prymnesium_polylepis.1